VTEQVQQWPEEISVAIIKGDEGDNLHALPIGEHYAEWTVGFPSARYILASQVEGLVEALEEIVAADCRVHLIQGCMFPNLNPQRVAIDALADFKGDQTHD
jgi:hypothetical protein